MMTTTVNERPILFSGPMVRAILDGRKTQTRRVVKPQPTWIESSGRWCWPIPKSSVNEGCCTEVVTASREWWEYLTPNQFPYGAPGERLWVRETWQPLWATDRRPPFGLEKPDGWRIGYVATDGVQEFSDEDADDGLSARCKPSIFMPRWASRLTLEIVSVRVERLQEISEGDVLAEGMFKWPLGYGFYTGGANYESRTFSSASRAFGGGWDTINGKRAPWASNPWVWVIEFKRTEPARDRAVE